MSFDEESIPLDLENLKQKLISSNERIIDLQLQNNEIESNFMRLQEQYTAADNARKLLEENINEMKSCEENFLQLQAQYTESSELVKELEDRIQQLDIANECKTMQLQSTILENNSLKAAQTENQNDLSDNILIKKIQILERRLETVTKEWQKQIEKTTRLSLEKIELESFIKNANATNEYQQLNGSTSNIPTQQNVRRNRKKQKATKMPALPTSLEAQNQGNSRNSCIRIKNLPASFIATPLELTVVNLAANINMRISVSDLLNVSFFDETKNILVVKFRTSQLKETFLAKKSMLKSYPLLEPAQIREFVTDSVYELYRYAKDKLKGQNQTFNCVYVANNKIYAKKCNTSREKPTEIKSKQHVDLILLDSIRSAVSVDPLNSEASGDDLLSRNLML